MEQGNEFFRDLNYDVVYIAEIYPRIDDTDILELADKEKRVIITNDKDFSELIFLQGKVSIGIILMRFDTEDTDIKISLLEILLKQYIHKIPKHFIVIDEKKIRIRVIQKTN